MRPKIFQHTVALCFAGLMLVPSLASAQDKSLTISCYFPSGETYDGATWIKGNNVFTIKDAKGNFLEDQSGSLFAKWHATEEFYEILFTTYATVKSHGVDFPVLRRIAISRDTGSARRQYVFLNADHVMKALDQDNDTTEPCTVVKKGEKRF